MWKTAIRLIPNHAPSHYQIGELMAGTVFTEDKDIPGSPHPGRRSFAAVLETTRLVSRPDHTVISSLESS
eukprot:3354609-Rhodomonas_salina.1